MLPEKVALEHAVTPRDHASVEEMDDFFVLFDGIGDQLADKIVYVHSVPGAAPGLAYFLAEPGAPG